MLITGYNKKRENVITSIEKFLTDCKNKGIITSGILDESGGMGSYETFYINFSINNEDYTIRFSDHSGSYSNPDFSLWNSDYKTLTELKKAILKCFQSCIK